MSIINPSELFNNVPDEVIHFNDFSLSHDNVHTTECGRITNICCIKVLPGEEYEMSLTPFVRTMPLYSPVYGKLDYSAYAFYVTNRSISNVWDDYIRAGEDSKTEYTPDLLYIKSEFEGEPLEVKSDAWGLYHVDQGLTGYEYGDLIYTYGQTEIRPFFAHGGMADMFGLGSLEFNYSDANGKYFYDVDSNPNYFHQIEPFSLIPFKAYQAAWSEYFADANVMKYDQMDTINFEWMKPINTITVNGQGALEVEYYIKDGTYTPEESDATLVHNLFRMRHRCYAKDYFTSALPEPQRGPDVLIPIGAQVEIMNDFDSIQDPTTIAGYGTTSAGLLLGIEEGGVKTPLKIVHADAAGAVGDVFGNAYVYNAQQLKAEIANLTATITDLRTACALQEFYESNARYGNRYKEFIYGNFGSMIPDNQLYRPWYLGGMKMPIQIGEVLQTSNDPDSTTGVGNMYGKAVSGGTGFLFKRKFDDYGVIIVLESIRPHNYYQNNLNRIWTVSDRLDEYWRKLQGVGEQEVKRWELTGFFSNNIDPSYLNDTFGYQMRYSEYKQMLDEVHGDFKGNLAYWTMARNFQGGVELDANFLTVSPRDINHIFQYTGCDSDHFLINSSFNIIRRTPMDIYSIPRIN